jgi:hypothetical protein
VEENQLTPSRWLADGAIERGTLGLHDADDIFLATGPADFAGAIIDAVEILVAARFVEGIAVRSVGKR